jgi:predicted nucleic acid-binding protein
MNIVSDSKVLLLDTNLLLLLFIGAKDSTLISKARTLKAFEEADYDLLIDVIDNSFNSLVTTPHIMTEVSNLLRKEREDIKCLGRESMIEFIDKCEEILEPSAVLVDKSEFMRLGLTDVAIAVASQLPAFVLTADADLYIHVSNSGLEA